MGLNRNEGAFFYPAIVNTYNEQQLAISVGKASSNLEDNLVDRLLESTTDFKKLHPINLIMANNIRRTGPLNGLTIQTVNEARNHIKETVKYSYFNSIDHHNLSQIAMKFINVSFPQKKMPH